MLQKAFRLLKNKDNHTKYRLPNSVFAVYVVVLCVLKHATISQCYFPFSLQNIKKILFHCTVDYCGSFEVGVYVFCRF